MPEVSPSSVRSLPPAVKLAAAVGAGLVVVALVLGFRPLHAAPGLGMDSASCGSAFAPSDSDAQLNAGAQRVANSMYPQVAQPTSYVAACHQARHTPLILGLVVGLAGVIVLASSFMASQRVAVIREAQPHGSGPVS